MPAETDLSWDDGARETGITMHDHSASGTGVFDWFTGGSSHPYMRLFECMSGDWFWIGATVALDFAVAAGYALIAMHWWKNQKLAANSPSKGALANLRNIFIFCGLCGYMFIPVKMIWPAWRLYDLFMLVLVYFTWRYAWGARDLKVLYSELQRTEKLESDLEISRAETKRKSFFLNAISHDLRTPLNGLVLQASVAEMHAEASEVAELRESLLEIKASAKAAAELLHSFLEVGRAEWQHEQNVISEFDLAELVDQIIGLHHPAAAAKGVYLKVEGDSDVPVRSDRIKMERIVSNLVGNAVKFTEMGGVTVRLERMGPNVMLSVADTGIGIGREHQGSLFQEFFQVHNHERDRTKGFGLGLAISQRLAHQLGGEIAVESEVGRGSCFKIRVPAALASAEAGGSVESARLVPA